MLETLTRPAPARRAISYAPVRMLWDHRQPVGAPSTGGLIAPACIERFAARLAARWQAIGIDTLAQQLAHDPWNRRE